MANFGLRGPDNALQPFDPVTPSPRPEGSISTSLSEFEGEASRGLFSRSNTEFMRMTSSDSTTEADHEMTEERFVAVASQLWAFNRRTARACFHAVDVDETRRMDKQQYALVREAFIEPTSECSEALLRVRLRAIFYKYVFGRTAQRYVSKDTTMTRDEAFLFVRDLCAGKAHVEHVAQSVLPMLRGLPQGDVAAAGMGSGSEIETEGITLDSFVNALSSGKLPEQIASRGILVSDLAASVRVAGQPQSYPVIYNRAVLDGRAETACMYSSGFRNVLKPPSTGISSDIVPADAVASYFEFDRDVRAVGGWRGPTAPKREAPEYLLAERVISVAMDFTREIFKQDDVLDGEWMPEGAALSKMLGVKSSEGWADRMCTLAHACQVQLKAQPSLVRVQPPTKVFGDIHGQFRDLLLLFSNYGFPSHLGGDIQTTTYVFNGDWVDRGAHQLEVVCLLFALKVMYPAQVFLVRGNHEFRQMSVEMEEDGFMHHMKQRFGIPQYLKPYDAVHTAFDWLPLAALVGGVVLVLHGGIGDGNWGLTDLVQVKRPMQIESDDVVRNVLWSDPSDSDSAMRKGVHENHERGSGIVEFGPDVTRAFCKREGLSVVIRSHQYVRQGYKVMHGGHLLTLFSARNYFEDDDNDGALVLCAPDDNGHLRLHPKRLVKLNLALAASSAPEPSPSGASGLVRRFLSCVC
mmetsp:Transcript_55778/g.98896  ORF Transcript_55778/g.98896 Transcript_55778/m.98896 type:complete len:691 (+) Transcript_55778:76-2148(+)